eukprot:3257937-Rhodomonas_salina.1
MKSCPGPRYPGYPPRYPEHSGSTKLIKNIEVVVCFFRCDFTVPCRDVSKKNRFVLFGLYKQPMYYQPGVTVIIMTSLNEPELCNL